MNKSCCDNRGCCDGDALCSDDPAAASLKTAVNKKSVMCVAVVRDSGHEVDVFDSAGRARTFVVENSKKLNELKNASSSKDGKDRLCFSTHGCGNGADGLLTPCFDENGEHGDPEEGCFCGVDTPHLHAHVHDPVRCSDDKANDKKKGLLGTDLTFLAQLTLHPKESDDDLANAEEKEASGEEALPLVKIPISESMPNQCNSAEYSKRLRENGMNASGSATTLRRRYQVQHDDHLDYLVHNDTTGNLHLEHPCNDCGDTDLHGKFNLVYKRCVSDLNLDDDSDSPEINLHFFEPSHRPFNLLDLLVDFFSTDTSRVAAVRAGCRKSDPNISRNHSDPCPCCAEDDAPQQSPPRLRRGSRGAALPACISMLRALDGVEDFNSNMKFVYRPPPCCDSGACTAATAPDCCNRDVCTAAEAVFELLQDVPIVNPPPGSSGGGGAAVRSEFFAAKICCASEIPAIRTIVEPLPGVTKVAINTPVKAVYVDHDPSQTTARDICDALNADKFGARIKKDGAALLGATGGAGGGDDVPRVGRSQLFVEKICCASEIPAIRKIVEPLPGVRRVAINVTTKLVCVDHDTKVMSAMEIVRALNDEKFGACLKKDAAQEFALLGGIPTSKFVESMIHVPNLSTKSDVKAFDVLLAKYEKERLKSFMIDLHLKTLRLEHNPYLLSAQTILGAVTERWPLASIVSDGAADGNWALPTTEEDAHDEIEKHMSSVNPYVALSGVFWAISMLSYIGGNWEYLKYCALVSVAFGLPSIGMKAFRTLKRCQFDANCMMFFAAVGALGLQEFVEAAAVTFLFAISEWLESRATARARNALSAIVNLRPDRANVINPVTKEIVVVPASVVSVGAIVSVRTGDKVPCDGVVIEGESTVDESSLTGESRPVKKVPRNVVSGGTINTGATQLVIRTTSTVENSAVARLIRLVEEAQANRSPTEKLVDEFAKRYAPLVVLCAISMCTIPWAFGRDVGREWTMTGLVTIVIACPCALIISTPVTYVAGLAATAQRGIVVKGGAHLEALGLVKKIAFDKTGTLTEGKFALLHLNTLNGHRTRKEVLQYLALVESRASHPLAAALVAAAKNENVCIPRHLSVSKHTILKGEGVMACVDGIDVHVGNVRLFTRLGLLDDLQNKDRALVDEWANAGGTVGFISIEGEGIVGAFCVADAVRAESKEVMHALKRLGINVVMFTGDNRPSALGIASQVGLVPAEVRSELLPEDKLQLVSELREDCASRASSRRNLCARRGNVLMCGDGVNDAPALAAADIGVAMGAGAALAMETSDVTLMDSNLKKLLYSIKMGKRVNQTIKENVSFSLLAKAVVMGFTFAGKTTLWAAIACDVGAMLIVTFNGMKLLPSRRAKNDLANEEHGVKADIEETITSYASQISRLSDHDDNAKGASFV